MKEFDLLEMPRRLPFDAAKMPKRKTSKESIAEIVAKRYLEEGDPNLVYFKEDFYHYTGTRYERLSAKEQALRLRRWLLRVKIPHGNRLVNEVIPHLQAMQLVQDTAQDPPFWKHPKGKPPASRVIAFANGLLDLDAYMRGKRQIMPHTPDWVSTACAPYSYDPDAECPEWTAFLNSVFSGDAERIQLLQEYLGYCLTPDTSRQKLLVMLGPIRAGKGTVMRIQRQLVGADTVVPYFIENFGERFGLGRLMGAYVAQIGEADLTANRNKRRIIERLNSIVGEDPVNIEEKGKNETHKVTLPTRFVICCNSMLNTPDDSGAFAARLLVLRFDRSFYGSEDRGLLGRLSGEIAGIANWALEGFARLQQQGEFTEPESHRSYQTEFRRTNDVFAFLQDECTVHRSLVTSPAAFPGVSITDRQCGVTLDQLYKQFQAWGEEQGRAEGKTKDWLVRDLKAIMPDFRTVRATSGGHKVQRCDGVALRGSFA